MARSKVYLVSNPAAGAKITDELLQVAKTELGKHNVQVEAEFQTQSANDGVRIGRHLSSDFLQLTDKGATATVILLGGDGTTYEVLNGLYGDMQLANSPLQVRLVVIPTGTANALYAGLYPPESSRRHVPLSASGTGTQHDWRLRSLHSFLKSDGSQASLYNLTVSRSQLTLSSDASTKAAFTHLVTSHALHAAILADSEALRAEHPGVERFKIAAAQNIDKWVDGQLTLHPRIGSGHVEEFDPAQRKIVSAGPFHGPLSLQGPIFYVICASTDRLEPCFVPATFAFPERANSAQKTPTSTSDDLLHLSRPADALDVVLIRPFNDPLVRRQAGQQQSAADDATAAARTRFAQTRAGPITQAMYNEGRHVFLRYPGDDQDPAADLSAENTGLPVIEYFRCAGYTWQPYKTSPRAHLTCLDGDIFEASETQTTTLEDLAGKIVVHV